MPLPAILCLCVSSLAHVAATPLPPVQIGSFGIPDTLFLVVLALIVFGPKKLPEISRQIGKLLYEFRKASNDFKFQIEEELRVAEQTERQKELSAQAKIAQPATPIAITAGETVSAEPIATERTAEQLSEEAPATESATAESATPATPETATSEMPGTPTIQPPASGPPVSTRSPYRPIENAQGAEVTAADESLDEPQPVDMPRASDKADEPQALDEMQADAQDAVRVAAADDPSYSQSGDAVPTHHG